MTNEQYREKIGDLASLLRELIDEAVQTKSSIDIVGFCICLRVIEMQIEGLEALNESPEK
jgi:hypothetical protein